MRIYTTILFLCLTSLQLSSCITNEVSPISGINPISNLPTTFTTENVMQVRQGMSSDDILTMFGEPKNIDVGICGISPKWTCTTWEYGKFPHNFALFTFSGNHGAMKLNNFEVKRD